MDYLGSLGLKRVLFDVKKENEYSIALIRSLPGAVLLSVEAGGMIYACPLRRPGSEKSEPGSTAPIPV